MKNYFPNMPIEDVTIYMSYSLEIINLLYFDKKTNQLMKVVTTSQGNESHSKYNIINQLSKRFINCIHRSEENLNSFGGQDFLDLLDDINKKIFGETLNEHYHRVHQENPDFYYHIAPLNITKVLYHIRHLKLGKQDPMTLFDGYYGNCIEELCELDTFSGLIMKPFFQNTPIPELKTNMIVSGIHIQIKNILDLFISEYTQLFVTLPNTSLCPQCGELYDLNQRGRYKKETCHKTKCVEELKRLKNNYSRTKNKEAENERQKKHRAIQSIISGKTTVTEQAKKLNKTTREIEQWIYDYKIKTNQGDKRFKKK
ncbi:hypothetical protein PDQ36_27870 [Bacillus cereus]|nr:hypothetical protein [Bacillus cereus]